MEKEKENNKLEISNTEHKEKVEKMVKKKYDPWKPFPKNIEIKIPKSSPTFSIDDVDKSIKKMMKELFGK